MSLLSSFERITRSVSLFTEEPVRTEDTSHPFEERNIHPGIPPKVRKLFDDAHYAQATFEAMKFLDKKVAAFSGLRKSGAGLMQEAFSEKAPKINLTPMVSISDEDEQKGYMWLFTGSVWAIRNPRGHEFDVKDDADLCLDHLNFASLLLRRMDQAGFRI